MTPEMQEFNDNEVIDHRGMCPLAFVVILPITVTLLAIVLLVDGLCRPIVHGTSYLFRRAHGGGPLNIETPSSEIDQ